MKLQLVQYALGQDVQNTLDLSPAIDLSTLIKIQRKSGIFSRQICAVHESAISLAKKIIASPAINETIKELDLIIVVSESKESPVPPISSLILDESGLLDGALVLDLDSGCAGYVQALQMVDAFFQDSRFRKAAIITTDAYSKILNLSDRSVAPIFGDGASISVLSNDGVKSVRSFDNGTDAAKYSYLKTTNGFNRSLEMNGAEIFMFVKARVAKSIRRCVEKGACALGEIDYFFLHQASALVIEELRGELDIDEKISPFKVSETGNLVSTSIPFALSEYINEVRNKKIILSGFGVGLTWSTALVEFG
jgi:3-oxoacyl-[acyl-carrier-protein] synthase III